MEINYSNENRKTFEHRICELFHDTPCMFYDPFIHTMTLIKRLEYIITKKLTNKEVIQILRFQMYGTIKDYTTTINRGL